MDVAPPSFLLTKKNPAPAGDEDGRMRPAASTSSRYFCMASLSGAHSEYNLPRGGVVPGRRSMAQLYGRWGGNDVALVLLKNCYRSKYSAGTHNRSGNSSFPEPAGKESLWKERQPPSPESYLCSSQYAGCVSLTKWLPRPAVVVGRLLCERKYFPGDCQWRLGSAQYPWNTSG